MKLSYVQNDDLTITIRDADGGPELRLGLALLMTELSKHGGSLTPEALAAIYRDYQSPKPDISSARAEGEDQQSVNIRVISEQHANNTSVLVGGKPISNVKALDWHVEAGAAGMLHIELILSSMELIASPESTQLHLPLPGGDLCLTMAQLMNIRDAMEAQKANGAVVLDEKWNGHDC